MGVNPDAPWIFHVGKDEKHWEGNSQIDENAPGDGIMVDHIREGVSQGRNGNP